jgi:hypothetical protein
MLEPWTTWVLKQFSIKVVTKWKATLCIAFFYKATPQNKTSQLFRGTPIKQDKPDLSASFYTKQNSAKQAQLTPYQSFTLGDYQSPVTFEIIPDLVGPIMLNLLQLWYWIVLTVK